MLRLADFLAPHMRWALLFALLQGQGLSATGDLPRSTPEMEGVDSAVIDEFLTALENSPVVLHSFMLVRHGHVVAEGWWRPYGPEQLHPVYSLLKNFSATAAGLAIATHRLALDDRIATWLSDQLPIVSSPNLASMKVRDLLTMTAGYAKDPLASQGPAIERGEAIRTILAQPVPHVPGTYFAYSNGTALLLSAVLQKATGQTLHEFLKPRLLVPLGISGEEWEIYPEGLNPGGTGLKLRTEDIAKLAQLYLQKGRWNDAQLLPEWWVRSATTLQTPSHYGANPDLRHGYGYMFWLAEGDAYRGYGSLDQNCLVLPAYDAVLVTTGDNRDSPAHFRLIRDRLLPAFHEGKLPFNPSARARLEARFRSLNVRSNK